MSAALGAGTQGLTAGPGPRSRTQSWTPERVREELKAFLAVQPVWPTYREFQRLGKRGLRDAVTRLGGARHWAAELGIPYIDHKPGYVPIWNEEKIRSELRSFLRGWAMWPRRKDFEAAGCKTLRDAVLRSGGPERWAPEFGLPRPDERSGSRRIWTEDRIEAEMRILLGSARCWPPSRTFLEAGEARLLAAVYAWGGVPHWCERLGIDAPEPSRSPRERQWDERRIGAELKQFCTGRARWPRFREFEEAGRGNLYRAASRTGGIPHWRRRLGLAP